MKKTVKQWIGLFLKIGLAAVVIAFELTLSIDFFSFVYPPDKWYMAYLGLGLTSGAMLIYMYLFAFDAESSLQKTLALIMMTVSIIGAILAAGFGMQVEAWKKSGISMTQDDIDFMILAVRLLLFVHAGVLALYFAGDKIVTALGDDDGDGIPNFVDPDYKAWKAQRKQAMRQFAADSPKSEGAEKSQTPPRQKPD